MMKRLLVVTLVLFGITAPAMALSSLAGSPSDSTSGSYNSKLERGIKAFYQADWKQARTTFEELQSARPSDSRAYFFDAMIPFWKYYFGGQSKETARNFMEQSEEAIEISRKQLSDNPHDTTMVLMLSGLYGYQSLVAANEGQYRTAIRQGMTGFQYTRQLLALDDDDPKALIGKGMFYYMVGSVPSGLKWVTNMMGVSADMQQGFKALKIAAGSESYVSNDAKMILAYLYERENKNEEALGYLQDLAKKYPQNIIFQYNKARLLEKCRKTDRARDAYQLVLNMEAQDLQTLKELSRTRLQKL